MVKMDFGLAYERTLREKTKLLRDARAAGSTDVSLGSGFSVDASRLSDRQIDDLALRAAERVVNRAIHEHNRELAQR